MSQFECFKCESKFYTSHSNVENHWSGTRGTAKCISSDNFYDEQGHSSEWARLKDGKVKARDDSEWRRIFGEGHCSVYLLLSENDLRVVVYAGKSADKRGVKFRLNTMGHVRAGEVAYLLASNLSAEGASELESHIIQCHRLGSCTLRNASYPWSRERKGHSSKHLRELTVEMVQGLFDRIDSGEAQPIIVIRKRSENAAEEELPRQSPSTERIAEMFVGRTPQQLNYLSKRAQQEATRTGSAKSTKRGRDDAGTGESTTPKVQKTG